MTELQIVCPQCNHEFALTASLAAPLIEATRKQFREQLAAKELEFSKKEEALVLEKDALAKARATFDDQVNKRIERERIQIVAIEGQKAREAAATDLANKTQQLEELRSILLVNNEKLAEAQKAQADLLRKQRELDDAKRELEVTIEKRIQATQAEILVKAKRDAEDLFKLQVNERDQQISSMAQQIDELRRRAEQGSQQAQGEALEIELEAVLRSRFPTDVIEPVGKGEFGGDLLQKVNAAVGQSAGTILWEFKRTKAWSDSWLVKLKGDQRAAKADVALIISHAMPKDVETFDLVEGVWVASLRCAIPVAASLRHSLIEISALRIARQGQQTKMEQVYDYLTGPVFKQRIEAAIEKFGAMRDDLDRERKFMTKQWAKREAQIISVIETTAGLHGELQGIAGNAIPEIPTIDMPQLTGPDGHGS